MGDLDLNTARPVEEFDLFAAARTLDNSRFAEHLGEPRREVLTLILQAVGLPDLKAEVARLTAANADLTDRLDRTLAELREVAKERDKAHAQAATARAEVERLHSWDGVMSLFDEHYPDSTYPTLPDRKGRDAGPRIISLIRTVDVLRAEAAAANAALADVSDLLDEARTERDAARQELEWVTGRAGRLTDAELEASDWDRDDAIQTRRADR